MLIFMVIIGLLHITSVTGSCPTGLPQGCTCTGTSYLYLTCNMIGKTNWPPFTSSLSTVTFNAVTFQEPGNLPILTAEALQYIKCHGSLFLRNLGIKEVHYNAFKTSSDTLQYLNMDHNNLTYFPSVALTSLSYPYPSVYMRYNNITSLDATWLPDNLYTLYLSNNDIHNIDQHFFHFTNRITLLDLSYNRLGDSDDLSSIGKLSRLTYLDMDHNGLRNIDSKMIPPSYQIYHLDLSYNQLGDDYKLPSILGKLNRLSYLNMGHTGLRNIDPKMFPTSNQITHLDLRDNHLEDEDVSVIVKLKKLSTIKLGHNLLTTQSLDLLYIDVFRNSTANSFTLEMNNNNLSTTPFLHNLLEIRINRFTLQLSHNQLSGFPDVIINGSRYISIDLSYNNLQNIPKVIAVSQNINSASLYLYADDNPLHCDCQMSWIRNSSYSLYTSLRTATCRMPEAFCGYYVGCYPLSNCHSNQSTGTFDQLCRSSPNTTCTAEKEGQVTQTTEITTTSTSDISTETSLHTSSEHTTQQDTDKQIEGNSKLKTVLTISLPSGGGLILLLVLVVICCVVYRRRKRTIPPPVPVNPTSSSATTKPESFYMNNYTAEPVYSNEAFETDENAYESLNAEDMLKYESNYELRK